MQHGLSPIQYFLQNSCKFCKFLNCNVSELAFAILDYLWFEFPKAIGLDFLSFPTTITNTLHELVHFNQSQSARCRIFPRELQSVYHPSKAHHASTIKPNFVYDRIACTVLALLCFSGFWTVKICHNVWCLSWASLSTRSSSLDTIRQVWNFLFTRQQMFLWSNINRPT